MAAGRRRKGREKEGREEKETRNKKEGGEERERNGKEGTKKGTTEERNQQPQMEAKKMAMKLNTTPGGVVSFIWTLPGI